MSFASAIRKTGQHLQLHEYQKDGVHWMLRNQNCGMFLPPGLGKTAIVLQAFKWMQKHAAAQKMIVIAPIRVMHLVWPIEIKKWADFNKLTITILHGPKKTQALSKDTDIYVINPEGLKWFSKYASEFFEGPNKWALVIDESSNFKNGRSQRFKLIKKWNYFDRRIILTGTPAPNGLINLWSQIYILDQGARLGKFVTAFRNRYFYPAGYMGYEFRLQDNADQRIYEAINDIVMHKGREEIDMPELITNEINVQLPLIARHTYEEMKRDFVALHNGKIIAAPTASTMGNKLRQMSSGAVYTDDDGTWVDVHDAKIEAVKELSDSLDGNPLLIFYEYRHDLARLQKAFPDSRYLGGGVKTKEAKEIVTLWNASEIPQLLLHPASAGHGLNLQEGKCTDLCWFTITWDQEMHEQAIGRVWRQGQKNGVTSHYIVADDTIDRHVIDVLEGKNNLQTALLNALKK
jgi:SNF2 family DNA or RNA helicase